MTTKALGTYLSLVRDLVRKLSAQEVAGKIATATGLPITAMDIRRIERGEPTTLTILTTFVHAIEADLQSALLLLEAEAPTDATIGALIRAMSTRRARSQPIAQRRSP